MDRRHGKGAGVTRVRMVRSRVCARVLIRPTGIAESWSTGVRRILARTEREKNNGLFDCFFTAPCMSIVHIYYLFSVIPAVGPMVAARIGGRAEQL